VGQRQRTLIPWWPITTVVFLGGAVVIAARAGRVIEAIIAAILLAPSLAILIAWVVIWGRRDLER
jgi:hypothetical protein